MLYSPAATDDLFMNAIREQIPGAVQSDPLFTIRVDGSFLHNDDLLRALIKSTPTSTSTFTFDMLPSQDSARLSALQRSGMLDQDLIIFAAQRFVGTQRQSARPIHLCCCRCATITRTPEMLVEWKICKFCHVELLCNACSDDQKPPICQECLASVRFVAVPCTMFVKERVPLSSVGRIRTKCIDCMKSTFVSCMAPQKGQ